MRLDTPFRQSALGLLACLISIGACTSSPAPSQKPSFTPTELAAVWDREHVSPDLPPLLNHAEVARRLTAVREATPDLFSLERVGSSVEGRSINHLAFGRGSFHVLMWSQMHGDEPTATAALFDIYEYVARHRADPAVARILSTLTLHTVPMLNPDGAERFERRNAQGIDINRDALALQTPEGRALKELRDRLRPVLGFNLHNQNWQTSVTRPAVPATVSLLAVAFDEARNDNPGRVLAKQVCAVLREALTPLAPGRIGRYDDGFEVRAFGDNLTKWGTSVVLIETGPWSADRPDPTLVRLNFVALLTALDALATGRAREVDPGGYESLPLNESRLFYRLIRSASIAAPPGRTPLTADIGIVARRAVEQVNGERRLKIVSRIEDLGDLRVFAALDTIDGTNLTVAPFHESYSVGNVIDQPLGPDEQDWRPETGDPADLVLLSVQPGGAYRVERVLRGEEFIP